MAEQCKVDDCTLVVVEHTDSYEQENRKLMRHYLVHLVEELRGLQTAIRHSGPQEARHKPVGGQPDPDTTATKIGPSGASETPKITKIIQ